MTSFSTAAARCGVVAGLLLGGLAHADTQGFISAAGRVDVAFDTNSDVLYISGTDMLRRYDMRTQSFLTPIHLGGQTLGMDISPDGKTLAVANDRGAGGPYVDLVNLASGTSSRVQFANAGGEGGSYSVAFDKQGKLLVTSSYQGSGWVPLRQYDSLTQTTNTLGSVRQSSMLTASGDRNTIGLAEANISSGAWGYYHAGDTRYQSQQQANAFTYEIGVSRDGSQFAVPTYFGTYVVTPGESSTKIGTYAGVTPIGAAYSPVSDRLFMAFADTNSLVEYDSRTLQVVNTFATPGTFNWIGNWAYGEGRTKVAGDGSYVFSTLDNGIFFAALPVVPEPSTYALMLAGLVLVGVRVRSSKRQG